jgi:hypothetical protein
MRKSSVFCVVLVLSNLLTCCSSSTEGDLQEAHPFAVHEKPLRYLFEKVNASEYLHASSGFKHIFLVPERACPSCHLKFDTYLDIILNQPQTVVVASKELPATGPNLFTIEDEVLSRLHLKTQRGIVYIQFQDSIQQLLPLDAFNIDSVMTHYALP